MSSIRISSGKGGKEAASEWYGNLVSWIRNQGGEIHSALDLDVVDKSSRGIKATADIEEGSVLIRLPAKLALDGSRLPMAYEMKDASGRDNHVSGKRRASPWLRCLTSLLTESAITNKNASDDAINFAPYLNSLPECYDTLMDELSWSNEDVATLLAGTALGTVVTEERKADMMKQRYKLSIVPYLQHVGLVATNDSSNSDNDYENFKKACACVSTRGFHLQQGDQQKAADTGATNDYSGPYLLPYIDLLNHSTEKKCTTLQRDTTDGTFVMIAERKINAGEEIFHTYGASLTAAQILQTFGFVEIGAARRAANSQWNDDQYGISPATLSAEAILNACRSIVDSSFPSDLQRSMEQNEFEDETWDVLAGKDRDVLSHGLISSDILVAADNLAALSDELVTLCCLPFLPDEVYREWSEEPCLWGAEVLQDYFLGTLALRALMKAIGAKLGEYTAIDASDCRLSKGDIEKGQDWALLKHLLDEQTDAIGSAKRSKAISALTIRLEEKHCLDLLKKQVLDTLKSLDDDGGGDFDEDDDANKGSDKRNADDGNDDFSSKKIKL